MNAFLNSTVPSVPPAQKTPFLVLHETPSATLYGIGPITHLPSLTRTALLSRYTFLPSLKSLPPAITKEPSGRKPWNERAALNGAVSPGFQSKATGDAKSEDALKKEKTNKRTCFLRPNITDSFH